MVFKNQKELEHFVMKQSRQALMKAQDEVYRVVKKWIGKYYKDYTPELYDRTAQLFGSLVESRIVQDGKGYKAEVYFDLSGFYDTGSNPTLEQVFNAAKMGLHGADGLHVEEGRQHISIWDNPIQELDTKAIDILVDMLKAEGIPVKKG